MERSQWSMNVRRAGGDASLIATVPDVRLSPSMPHQYVKLQSSGNDRGTTQLRPSRRHGNRSTAAACLRRGSNLIDKPQPIGADHDRKILTFAAWRRVTVCALLPKNNKGFPVRRQAGDRLRGLYKPRRFRVRNAHDGTRDFYDPLAAFVRSGSKPGAHGSWRFSTSNPNENSAAIRPRCDRRPRPGSRCRR